MQTCLDCCNDRSSQPPRFSRNILDFRRTTTPWNPTENVCPCFQKKLLLDAGFLSCSIHLILSHFHCGLTSSPDCAPFSLFSNFAASSASACFFKRTNDSSATRESSGRSALR